MQKELLTHVLLVEDSARDAELIVNRLLECHRNFVVYRVDTEKDLRRQLNAQSWDLVLSDHNLPSMDSERVLEVLDEYGLKNLLPMVIVSGRIGEEPAVKLMRCGARDYVSKGCLNRLVPVIENVLSEHELRLEKEASDRELAKVCSQLKESNEKLKQTLQTVTQAQESLVKVERFKALGELSGGIAHDFNNLLTKVIGVVEGMQERLPAGVEEEALGQLRLLSTDGAAIIRRLRDFYATRSQDQETTPVDLNQLVQETVQLTKPKWQNELTKGGGIHIMESFQGDSWVSVDPSHMREVLTNLIFNACDAMSESGGELTVQTSRDDSMAVIEIRDTGCGMSEETRQRCLEPFYSTKGDAGTGLGLALAANVVRGYGGVLDVKSKEGVGTSIFIRLPLQMDGPCCILPKDEVEAPKQELTVMVVDDDPIIASLLAQYLKLEGHQTITITDPRKVVAALKDGGVDVVITDRSMPEMSGDELSCLVKDAIPGLPVIMATGYGDLMMVNGDKPGMVDYVLPKPISREDLRSSLTAVTSARLDAGKRMAA